MVDDGTKSCSVVWEELVSDEAGYLAENFETQVEGLALLLIVM